MFEQKGEKKMKKKLLIVVDYQNDFVAGSLGFPGAAAIEDNIAAKIQEYRELGEAGQIIFTMDTHGKDYLKTQEGINLPVEHCIKGFDGWQLYGKIGTLQTEEDLVFFLIHDPLPISILDKLCFKLLGSTTCSNTSRTEMA